VNPVTRHQLEHPVVGGIYRDKSGQSLAVLSIVGDEALLEYADGSITTIEVSHWPLLHPQPAVF
jgi:hypothetical protein